MDFNTIMSPWKRGALVGGAAGLLIIIALFILRDNKAYAVMLFYPDFIIVGAVIGYLYGRFISIPQDQEGF